MLEKARESNCRIVSFSSGGKIEDYCIKHGTEFIKLPVLNSPRASLPFYLYSILNSLEELTPIKRSDVLESIQMLGKN